jgi:hypothetical protein
LLCSVNGGHVAVNGVVLHGRDRAHLVDRLAHHVQNAAQRGLAHRHLNGRSGVLHRQPARQTVGGVHGDAAHGVLAQVLRHLDSEVVGQVVDGRVGDLERRVHLGQASRRELDVDDGTENLRDAASGRDESAHDGSRE